MPRLGGDLTDEPPLENGDGTGGHSGEYPLSYTEVLGNGTGGGVLLFDWLYNQYGFDERERYFDWEAE